MSMHSWSEGHTLWASPVIWQDNQTIDTFHLSYTPERTSIRTLIEEIFPLRFAQCIPSIRCVGADLISTPIHESATILRIISRSTYTKISCIGAPTK